MSTGDNPTGFRPADHPLFSGDVDVPPAPEASSAVLAALLGRAMRVADEGSASLAVVDLAVHAWMEGHLSGEDHCDGCDGRCGFDRGAGRRYRSLGCAPCTGDVCSAATSPREIIVELRSTTVAERSGRAQDQADPHAMEKLRRDGYM